MCCLLSQKNKTEIILHFAMDHKHVYATKCGSFRLWFRETLARLYWGLGIESNTQGPYLFTKCKTLPVFPPWILTHTDTQILLFQQQLKANSEPLAASQWVGCLIDLRSDTLLMGILGEKGRLITGQQSE